MREFNLPSNVLGMGRNALAVGVLGVLISALGFGLTFAGIVSIEQFYQSYLLGFVFMIQFPLGCLGILMIHHLTGGRWGFAIRRMLEAGAMTIPIAGLFFIPVLLGMNYLYPWLHELEDPLIQHKAPYLNTPFFISRTVLYFVIWSALAFLLNRWSREQDETGVGNVGRFKSLSALGMILFAITTTFAAYDWMMSLKPHWFSSIYGVIFMSGQAVSTIALALIMGRSLRHQAPLSDWFSIDIFNDLANFLLAFISFWAYVSFSQYLIIYSSNLPETVTWYIIRNDGGWQFVAMALIFLHFALPFAFLLSRRMKRTIGVLVPLSIFVILMRWVDLFYHITPNFYSTFAVHWLDFAVPIGLGGIWLWLFFSNLKGKPLVAQHDPRFQEAPAHG